MGERSWSASWWTSVPFVVCHLVPFLAVFTGVGVGDLVLCGVLYGGRVFVVTAGYHRCFTHRAFGVGRVTQFVLAFGSLTAAQKGPAPRPHPSGEPGPSLAALASRRRRLG